MCCIFAFCLPKNKMFYGVIDGSGFKIDKYNPSICLFSVKFHIEIEENLIAF